MEPELAIEPPVKSAVKPESWITPELANGCVILVVPCGTESIPLEFTNGTVIVPGPAILPPELFNSPLPATVDESRLRVPRFASVLPLSRS